MKLDSHQVVFVLRVEHNFVDGFAGLEPSKPHSLLQKNTNRVQEIEFLYHLHDLRRGMQFTFSSWQEIQDYIKENAKQGLR